MVKKVLIFAILIVNIYGMTPAEKLKAFGTTSLSKKECKSLNLIWNSNGCFSAIELSQIKRKAEKEKLEELEKERKVKKEKLEKERKIRERKIQSENPDLKLKYEIFSEYLGIKTLDLNEEQLIKIVPKLEKKMNKDKNYKNLRLQNKLNKLNKLNSAIKPIEQTICFSKKGKYLAMLGDNVSLSGGKCKGRVLSEMNKDGWELIQVIGGLQSSFGMVFTRK